MSVLNPTSILSQGGGLGVGQRAIGLAGMLQQQKANEQKIQSNEMAMQAEQKRQEQMPQIMQQAQDLYKSGDIDAIAEFSIANPQLGEQILKMRGLSEGEGKQRVSDRFSRIYTSRNPRADLAQEIEAGTAQGLDMSDSIALLESNATDDEIRQQAGIALASVDPSRQQSISKAMTTGQPKKQGQPAASIQELEQYNSMPEGPLKEAYGRKIGMVTKEGFELSAPAAKLIEQADSDYRESQINSGKYENLANQFENLDTAGGAIGSAYEAFKEFSGNQDEVTDLKKRYSRIVNKQVMASLPPGAASDKDISYARKGFLPDNANPKQIASFLRGISKLEKAKGLYSEWRSNYISENGGIRNVTKEWNKYRKSPEYKERYNSLLEEQELQNKTSTINEEIDFTSLSDEELIGG